MADESWVFDSLICFLHSPSWNAALSTFIEEKSLIFDPNVEIDITNPEYLVIHNEYKNLVDYMLGSFMEEMKITPEQFEIACLDGKNLCTLNKDEPSDSHSFSFHKGLFQQIWAANDIRTFIRLMVQRNVELQLQALDLIERRQASIASQDGSEDNERNVEQVDVDIEKAVIHETVEEFTKPGKKKSEEQQEQQDDDKFKRLNLFFEQEKIKTTDVSSRQEYLRAQRDKILLIKKQARARQLHETTKDRPKSAKAAQKVIDGEIETADESSVQFRKILAKKLRDEVVNNGIKE
ncbi:unnamed protein product [Diamesa serratosioi]